MSKPGRQPQLILMMRPAASDAARKLKANGNRKFRAAIDRNMPDQHAKPAPIV